MYTGTATLELYIAESNSLKDKRRVIKSLKDRIRQKFNVSIAEIDYQDRWRRASLGIAAVSNCKGQVDKILDSVVDYIDGEGMAEILSCEKIIY